MYYYEKVIEKSIEKAKKYALKKFVKSDYLKETTSILPLTILSIITRSIFNFLITYRLKTNIYILDISFSILITIFFSLSAPFFYNIFSTLLKNEVNDFSKNIINSFWKDGWNYYNYWKNRILGSFGIFCIFLLFFIEINSLMIQEFILHTLISSAIVDYINNRQEIDQKVRFLSTNQMIESYYPEREIGEKVEKAGKEEVEKGGREEKVEKGGKVKKEEEKKEEKKEEFVKVKEGEEEGEEKINFRKVRQSSSGENYDPLIFSLLENYEK